MKQGANIKLDTESGRTCECGEVMSDGFSAHIDEQCVFCSEGECECEKSRWLPCYYGLTYCSKTEKTHHGGWFICEKCNRHFANRKKPAAELMLDSDVHRM